jgi:hypothetical protein
MTLLTATDNGLMMGLFIGIIFCIITIWGIISTVKIAIKPKENQNRRNYIIGSILGIVVFYFIAQIPFTEYNLLYNYIWVDGKLINKCYSKGSGQSYEFEYYVDGKRYTNCNNSGNVKGIKFPNGQYKVRVSRAMPGIGRIDYEQEIATIRE